MIIDEADVVKRVEEYFFSSKLREIANMRKQGIPVINLGIGSPDSPPHVSVLNAMHESLDNPGAHGYQAYKGNENLLDSMASWYNKFFGLQLIGNEHFLPLNGSKEGISFILHAFINPGDKVLIPNPGYPTYTSAALLHYAEVDYYALRSENYYYPDFDLLEKQITPRTKIIFLNYAHMPTGAPATIEVFDKFVSLAKKYKILLVNDNPYIFLHDKQLSIFAVEGAMDVAIELNSLSKSHNLAGWRVGMAVGAPDYIKLLLKMRSNANSGHFLPIQHAAIEAMNLPDEWYAEQLAIYKRRREIIFPLLRFIDAEFIENQAGMFVWAKIPKQFDSGAALADFILKKAFVFVTEGAVFGSEGEQYFRISLSINDKELSDAAMRIKDLWLKEGYK
jgi:aspartate/methionine/tyrosine aminotransferase